MKSVVVVDRDDHARTLLVRFLEAHGWSALPMDDGRRFVRRWSRNTGAAPLVVLVLRSDDFDDFELLGAVASHVLVARVLVCAPKEIDLAPLGVERVLPSRARFSEILANLEEMNQGFAVSEAAE